MTVGIFPGLKQTLAYTVRAHDDGRYFSGAGLRMTICTSFGLRLTLAYTVRAKDDHRYFSWAQADPRVKC